MESERMEEQREALCSLLNKKGFIVHDYHRERGISLREKTKDRRIQKTRKLLHEALISLILKKDYKSITIQEIIDRANVGRSTFYTHFQDKDDLLISEMDGLRDILRTAQMKTPVASGKSYERVIGFSSMMFEHAYEYRHVYKALIGSQAGAVVLQHIPDMLVDLIRDESKVEFEKKRRKDSEIPFELFVHFIASAFVSVMSWWLYHKNPLPPKTINAIFRALVIPSLAANFD